ncbi:MAG: hypothetical protein ABI835_21055, partial [Chloroflexota bacterium]
QLGIPWLMSRGMVIFQNLIENRPPATAAFLSLVFRLLPSAEPILIVRMLNLLLVLALTLLLGEIARRITGSLLAGLCTVIFWALWEPVYGNLLFYFDTLVGATFALTIFVWLITAERRLAWLAPFLCGVLLGGATLFKQPAWAGVILFAIWLVFFARRGRQLPAFMIGALIVPLGAMAIFASQGTLDAYLFWNYRRYFSGIPNAGTLSGNTLRKFLLTNIFAPVFLLFTLRSDEKRVRWLVLALWLAGGATLLPGWGEIYVMAHLPVLSVMSGIVIASVLSSLDFGLLRTPMRWLREARSETLVLAGLALALAFGSAWTIVVTYVPGPLGRAGIPAYDEFKPVAARLEAVRQPGDTLFMLPMSDGNPQLYVLTGMLPPGTFINSHKVFLTVPGVVDKLIAEWEVNPPKLIVDFPQARPEFEPEIVPLVAFMQAHYHPIDQVDDVPFNGDAIIYRLND